MSETIRERLGAARRVVVKIGSRSLLATESGRFEQLAAQVARLREQGRAAIIVSSGAVAIGRRRLGLSARPTDIAHAQAVAAVGQSGLIRSYEEAFAQHALGVAHVLVTHADLEHRERFLNARRALGALLDLGVVPVINENDTVAVDELRFGDNDQLAAMIANVAAADVLVLLTDVQGVLDGQGARVSVIRSRAEVDAFVRPSADDVGRGGMASKLEAAQRAAHQGVPVVIGDAGDPELLAKVVRGDDVGTLFAPAHEPLPSRKHWIAYTLRPRGALVVDAGAVRALVERHSSLLPSGIVGVRGDFEPGDSVSIVSADGAEVARGLTRYGTRQAAQLAGARSADIRRRIGQHDGDVVVHRDDLVVF